MVTLSELQAKLAEQFDEVTLLELLEINSYDIAERFLDKIEDKYDSLVNEVD